MAQTDIDGISKFHVLNGIHYFQKLNGKHN